MHSINIKIIGVQQANYPISTTYKLPEDDAVSPKHNGAIINQFYTIHMRTGWCKQYMLSNQNAWYKHKK